MNRVGVTAGANAATRADTVGRIAAKPGVAQPLPGSAKTRCMSMTPRCRPVGAPVTGSSGCSVALLGGLCSVVCGPDVVLEDQAGHREQQDDPGDHHGPDV